MDAFAALLQEATRRVGETYFQLPVAGQEDPIYRERVYCYELYHQLRRLWPPDSRYSLCGEVDKRKHPLIRGNNLDNTKPDFLVHVPGGLHNAVVMEVKPANAKPDDIAKDLKKLTAYRRLAGYATAYLLVYGHSDDPARSVQDVEVACVARDGEGEIDLHLIQLWHHEAPGSPACSVPWHS